MDAASLVSRLAADPVTFYVAHGDIIMRGLRDSAIVLFRHRLADQPRGHEFAAYDLKVGRVRLAFDLKGGRIGFGDPLVEGFDVLMGVALGRMLMVAAAVPVIGNVGDMLAVNVDLGGVAVGFLRGPRDMLDGGGVRS